MSKSLMKLSLLMFGVFLCCFHSVTCWKERTRERNVIHRCKRVVGGKSASSGQWPWQAVVCILGRFELRRKCACGGTLIGPKWVVTAAHCFNEYEGPDTFDTLVLFGVDNLRSKSLTRQSRYVIRYFKHPSYDWKTYFADITLLELKTAVTYNKHVQPVMLPNITATVTSDQSCIVSGYGNTKRKRKNVKSHKGNKGVLNYAEVEIIPLHTCKSWYFKRKRNISVPDDHLCAGYESGGKDTCQGDSGGPLVCAKLHDHGNPIPADYFLMGVTSFGQGCGKRHRPGVYTNVTVYLDWILQHVEASTTSAPSSQQSGIVRTNGSVRTTTSSITLAPGAQQSTSGSGSNTTTSITPAPSSQQSSSIRSSGLNRTTTIHTTTAPGSRQTTSGSEAQIAISYFVQLRFTLLKLLMQLII